MTTIRVNGHVVEASSQSPGGRHYIDDACNSNYILIQYTHSLSQDEVSELFELGVDCLERVGVESFRCRYLATDLDVLRQLKYVAYANVYHSDLAVHASLSADATGTPQDQSAYPEPREDILIALHSGTDEVASSVRQQLVAILGVDNDDIIGEVSFLQTKAPISQLPRIAQLDEVSQIIRPPEAQLRCCNDKTRQTLGWGPGLFSRHVKGTEMFARNALDIYDGKGEVVAVMDSGYDLGQPPNDPDNRNGHPAFRGRIRYWGDCEAGGPITCQDRIGHGTHVAASVGGVAESSEQGFGTIKGIATGIELAVQSLANATGEIGAVSPANFPKYMSRPCALATQGGVGSRVSNCSLAGEWTDDAGP
jgi:subtilisin family serine protease